MHQIIYYSMRFVEYLVEEIRTAYHLTVKERKEIANKLSSKYVFILGTQGFVVIVAISIEKL